MTLPKYLNIFFVVFLTASLTASCKDNKVKSAQNHPAFQKVLNDSLPKPVGYVNDFEHVFIYRERVTLDSLLSDFDKRTTIQIAVITFDTSMTTADSLDAFTLRIAKAWGVGQKDKNNGVVIGISKAYRKMSIQNGYGIEKVLTNAETKEIIDTAFIPSFRDANYFDGTLNGIKALISILEKRYK